MKPREYLTIPETGPETMTKTVEKGSAAYPPQLLPYPNMPVCLYVRGNLPDPRKKSVAIVGARSCSAYGRAEAARFAQALAAAGVQIISGMAYGIDTCAHTAALRAGGTTFAVFGCGTDICYPPENRELYLRILREGGGLLSEFTPGTPPLGYHFPIRNRIISALADLVLVVEARLKSGSLITADRALEQGKSVFAVPGRNGDRLSEGCNRLLSQGAGVARSPQAVLKELGISAGAEDAPKKEPAAQFKKDPFRRILRALSRGEKNLVQLQTETGLAPQELAGALMQLCLSGYAAELRPGTFYKV